MKHKAAIVAMSLVNTGCTSIAALTDRDDSPIEDEGSIRVERVELLDERGSMKSCTGRLVISSHEFANTLRALRKAIDTNAPGATMGAISFTWYWQRLPRGCVVGNVP